MRQKSNERYSRLKAEGVIKLKGRPQSKYGKNGKDHMVYGFIIEQKIALKECLDCGLVCEEWNHVMFAFDHIDPATKSFAISKARTSNVTLQMIMDEIKKCDLLCHNCHAFRTWVFRDHDVSKRQTEEPPLLALMSNQ